MSSNQATDIELYDKAVVDYFKNITTKVIYSPTDTADYNITKKYNTPEDSIPYPFISVYRDPSMPIDWSRYSNHTIRSDFVRLSSTQNSGRVARYVHSIPVNLSYQADIWGIRSTEVLQLSQSTLLRLTVTNPVLLVPINPEGENGRFCIESVEVVDNSDIQSEIDRGRIYRHTFSFTIDARIKLVKDINVDQFETPEVHAYDENSIYNF